MQSVYEYSKKQTIKLPRLFLFLGITNFVEFGCTGTVFLRTSLFVFLTTFCVLAFTRCFNGISSSVNDNDDCFILVTR